MMTARVIPTILRLPRARHSYIVVTTLAVVMPLAGIILEVIIGVRVLIYNR